MSKFWETTDGEMEDLLNNIGAIKSRNQETLFLAQILCQLHEIKNLLKDKK